MIDVFLSASVPLPERDRAFFDTADVLAIREAVKALVEVVLPKGRITFGGHPAITPLLSLFVKEANLPRERVTIFQTAFFGKNIPPEVQEFLDVHITPARQDLDTSLAEMRSEMIKSRPFHAMVIIGGMEGVFKELSIFESENPDALVLPIASTGAAAEIVYAKGHYDKGLANDLTYASLFRRRLLQV